MATTQTCKKCGCEDSFLTSPAPCPTPADCPNPEVCSESFDAQCIVYTSLDILCGQDVVVEQNTNLADALNDIVDYFCGAADLPLITVDIICQDTTIATVGDTIQQALVDVTAYFCNEFANINQVVVNADDESISVDVNTVGNITTYSVSVSDTGWKNLEGFNYYTGAMNTQKPQCRKIGKQIHFRGDVYIPITDGANVIPITTPNTYRTVPRITPFTGTGGVVYDASGNMFFNRSGATAQSVIPTTVLPAIKLLDGEYDLQREIASRQILVNTQFPNLGDAGTALLNAPIKVSILADKTLRFTALETMEQNSADVVSFAGSSVLRNITSSFVGRNAMINFISHITNYDSIQSTSSSILNYGAQLIVGQLYYIYDYNVGDDFTNVGALVNQTGQWFVATGINPTTWTNLSLLVDVAGFEANNFFYPNPIQNSSATSAKWPILDDGLRFDGADATNLGGFKISLDGLMAYVD
jgi:hypothetical protein